MRRLTLAVALSILCCLNLAVHAQSNPPADDASAIRTTVTNYSEAYFTGDSRRMEQTLHPHYLKHMIHGSIPVREKTGRQMVEEVRKNGPSEITPAQKAEQVIVLDVAGVIASAKLITPGWTDYMTLSKVDGQWKILSVVQRIDD